MIKWSLIVLAGFAGLVLLLVVIGWMLPVGHRAEGTRWIPAEPERVWAAITNVTDYPAWRPDVSTVDILPDDGGGLRFREHGRNGPLTFRVLPHAPPRETATGPLTLVTRIDDAAQPFGGTWTYTLVREDTAAGPGTRITIVEDGEVYNPIFRVLSRFVFSQTATLKAYLDSLERRFPPTSGTTSSP